MNFLTAGIVANAPKFPSSGSTRETSSFVAYTMRRDYLTELSEFYNSVNVIVHGRTFDVSELSICILRHYAVLLDFAPLNRPAS